MIGRSKTPLPIRPLHRRGCPVAFREVAWLKGEGPYPEWISKKESPVWTRRFSSDVDEEACTILNDVLKRLGVKRMIVGHTAHVEGIQSYCTGQVWCIDTGMSEYYGGILQVLEITGSSIRVLTEGSLSRAGSR